MFYGISWNSYWLSLALLTAGYYLVIYLLYFRSDFKVNIPLRSPGPQTSQPPAFSREELSSPAVQASLFAEEDALQESEAFKAPEEMQAESCLDELIAFFEEARSRKWSKKELLHALRGILGKYPLLTGSSYQESLTKIILTRSEQVCSLHLKAEDTAHLW